MKLDNATHLAQPQTRRSPSAQGQAQTDTRAPSASDPTPKQTVALGSIQSLSRGYAGAKSKSNSGLSGSDSVTLSPEVMNTRAQQALETEVGQKISAAFKEAGVDLDQAMGMDWSVDATAQRIADFATGFFQTYKDQHPELSEEEASEGFETLMRGAIDKGAGQALEILQGMSVDSEITTRATDTITKVHSLLDDFFAKTRKSTEEDSQQVAS